jgi:hypothetical protein
MTTVPDAVVARAQYHRRQPVIVYDRSVLCPGGATLVRNGKQVKRGWDEVASLLEQEGLGTWGQRQLSIAAKRAK